MVRVDELVTYRVVYKRRSDGKTRQITLGKASQIGLREARRHAKRIMGQVAEGKDPAAQHAEWTEASTFSELAQQWLSFKQRQGRAKGYTDDAARRIRGLPDWFSSKKASDIRRIDVAVVLDAKAESGQKYETNRVQALISAIFKWALSEGRLASDPSHGLKRRFDETARERVFSKEEIHTIWHGIDSAKGSEASKLALKLCLVLGQRPKEIAAIRQDKLRLGREEPATNIARQRCSQ